MKYKNKQEPMIDVSPKFVQFGPCPSELSPFLPSERVLEKLTKKIDKIRQ